MYAAVSLIVTAVPSSGSEVTAECSVVSYKVSSSEELSAVVLICEESSCVAKAGLLGLGVYSLGKS